MLARPGKRIGLLPERSGAEALLQGDVGLRRERADLEDLESGHEGAEGNWGKPQS